MERAHAAEGVGLRVSAQEHMAHFGVHQAMHQPAVNHATAANARTNRQI